MLPTFDIAARRAVRYGNRMIASSESSPPDGRWSRVWLTLALLAGSLVGLGIVTLRYSGAFSYLSDAPEACANCHIMADQFDSWRRGPHHAGATCNDCHVPPHFPDKYVAKALNGYHHSKGFTLQPSRPDEEGARLAFEEPIRIRPANSQTLQDNCLRCHGDFMHDVVRGSTWAENAIRCVHCHRAVGHGALR